MQYDLPVNPEHEALSQGKEGYTRTDYHLCPAAGRHNGMQIA
jgi:hypothetical protein